MNNKKWSVGWGPIVDCNMKCKFCYSKKVRSESIPEQLLLEDWKNFIDINYNHISAINYGTGENTISDEWFELIDYISSKYKIEQALTTNGYISQRIKENSRYEEIFLKSINEVDVSLDFGISHKHNEFRGQSNAYDWVMDTLSYCNKQRIETTIVFIGTKDTLMKNNLKLLFEIAKKYNCKLRMNIYRPTSLSPDLSNEFIASYNDIVNALKYISENYKVLSISDSLFASILVEEVEVSDPSGTESIRILGDGSITPSTYLVTDNFRIMNIKDSVSLETLSSMEEVISRTIPVECNSCKYKERCRGGVYDRRYLWYETFDQRDPYCPYRHNHIEPDFKIKLHNDVNFKSIHEGYLPTMFFSN